MKGFLRNGISKIRNNRKVIAVSTAFMTAAPVVFAEDGTGSAATMIDVSKIDFTPLLVTIAAVIGVALTPMITVAAGKKGLSFVKSMINKVG